MFMHKQHKINRRYRDTKLIVVFQKNFLFLVFWYCRIGYDVLTAKIEFFFSIDAYVIFNRFNYVFNSKIISFATTYMHMIFFRDKKEENNGFQLTYFIINILLCHMKIGNKLSIAICATVGKVK